jgi:hypothetical protein
MATPTQSNKEFAMKALNSSRRVRALALIGTLAGSTTSAVAHEDAGTSSLPPASIPPAALAQLEQVRHAAAKYFDVKAAEADGYVDIGLDIGNMGLHFLNFDLVNDGVFDPKTPEALVYQFDLQSNEYRLVAVEYVSPLTSRAPEGFIGPADQWGKFGDLFWTLHAWVYEFNPTGVFAPTNPRMPAK